MNNREEMIISAEDIVISTEDCERLEKLHYSYCAARDNVAYLIDSHSQENDYLESKQFKDYQAKEFELFKEYENAKNEITIKYIPTEYLLTGNFYWEVDFKHHLLMIKASNK